MKLFNPGFFCGTVMVLFLAGCSGSPHPDALTAFKEGNIQFGRHNFEGASRAYTLAISKDGKFLPARIMLGKLLYYQHKLPEAGRQFESVLSREPHNIDGLLWMAKVDSRGPDRPSWERAVQRLDTLLERDSSHVEAWYLKGTVLEQQGKIPESIAAYRSATKNGEYLALAHLRLAIVYRKAGLTDQAELQLRQATVVSQDNPALLTQVRKAWRRPD